MDLFGSVLRPMFSILPGDRVRTAVYRRHHWPQSYLESLRKQTCLDDSQESVQDMNVNLKKSFGLYGRTLLRRTFPLKVWQII